jgi:hypothetical protein
MSVVSRGLKTIFDTLLKFHPISLATNPKILFPGTFIGAGIQMASYGDDPTLTYPEKVTTISLNGLQGAFVGFVTTAFVCATYPIIIAATIVSIATK